MNMRVIQNIQNIDSLRLVIPHIKNIIAEWLKMNVQVEQITVGE